MKDWLTRNAAIMALVTLSAILLTIVLTGCGGGGEPCPASSPIVNGVCVDKTIQPVDCSASGACK